MELCAGSRTCSKRRMTRTSTSSLSTWRQTCTQSLEQTSWRMYTSSTSCTRHVSSFPVSTYCQRLHHLQEETDTISVNTILPKEERRAGCGGIKGCESACIGFQGVEVHAHSRAAAQRHQGAPSFDAVFSSMMTTKTVILILQDEKCIFGGGSISSFARLNLADSGSSLAAQQPAAEQRVPGEAGRLWVSQVGSPAGGRCGGNLPGPHRLCGHAVVQSA